MKARLRAKSVKESFAISFTCRRQCRSKRQKGAISFLRNRIENVNKRDTRSSLLFCPADITERCIFIFILEKCDLSALKSISLRVQAPSRGIVEHVKDWSPHLRFSPKVFEKTSSHTTDEFQLCVADLLIGEESKRHRLLQASWRSKTVSIFRRGLRVYDKLDWRSSTEWRYLPTNWSRFWLHLRLHNDEVSHALWGSNYMWLAIETRGGLFDGWDLVRRAKR